MVGREFEDLIRKPADDDYIFRGEDRCNKYVSSGLFREYCYPWDVEAYQWLEIEDAKRYIPETDDRAILTEIQHYGGNTNLIDFTTNYYIALFFACAAKFSEYGRVIILNRYGEMSAHIFDPDARISRVKSQESIFVQPPKGYIEDGLYETLTVPSHLKKRLLNYLKDEHSISKRSVYNDLHGFIRYSNERRKAYFNLLEGRRCHQEGHICAAIEHYGEAISLNPELVDAYNNRGLAYKSLGKYEVAIEDYNIAQQLHPNAILFHNRGCAYSALGEYELAVHDFDKSLARGFGLKNKSVTYGHRGWALLHRFDWRGARIDFVRAERLGWDIKLQFHDYYTSVADFEQRNNVKMPKGIATMLSE